MCGFCGFTGQTDNNQEVISNMMQKIIHRGIICNKCGKKDIKGKRYKCAQCSNFNLCEKCENNYIPSVRRHKCQLSLPARAQSFLFFLSDCYISALSIRLLNGKGN